LFYIKQTISYQDRLAGELKKVPPVQSLCTTGDVELVFISGPPHQARKTEAPFSFFSNSLLRLTSVLPRQARDRQTNKYMLTYIETATQQHIIYKWHILSEWRFLSCLCTDRTRSGPRLRRQAFTGPIAAQRVPPPLRHTHTQPSFSRIDNRYQNDRFTKTGSGHTQTQNIHSKRTLKKGGWLSILAEIRSLINEEVRKRLFGAIFY
jgi:hypothetical protein